jgi:DNA-binding NarL/FixJ family response regulator
VVRCFVADDHAAVRAGLLALLRSEPGFVPIGAGASAADALEKLQHLRADLALVDYHLPDRDGLALCCDVKALTPAPSVVIYSAFAGPRLSVAATVAGADAVLAKGASVEKMFELLRSVARGSLSSPDKPPQGVDVLMELLEPADLPIFGMAMARTPLEEMAAVAGENVATVRGKIRAIVGKLAPTHADGG